MAKAQGRVAAAAARRSGVLDAMKNAGMPTSGAAKAFDAHTRPPIGETGKPGRTFSADGGLTLGAIGAALAVGAATAIGSRIANAAIDRFGQEKTIAGGKGSGRGGGGRG
jgi:hypothetical protein